MKGTSCKPVNRNKSASLVDIKLACGEYLETAIAAELKCKLGNLRDLGNLGILIHASHPVHLPHFLFSISASAL